MDGKDTIDTSDALEQARSFAQSNDHQQAQTWAMIASAEALHKLAHPLVSMSGAIVVQTQSPHDEAELARAVMERIHKRTNQFQNVEAGMGVARAEKQRSLRAALVEAYEAVKTETFLQNARKTSGMPISGPDVRRFQTILQTYRDAQKAYREAVRTNP